MTKGPCYRANMGCVVTSFVLQSDIESTRCICIKTLLIFNIKFCVAISWYLLLLLFFSISWDAFFFLNSYLTFVLFKTKYNLDRFVPTITAAKECQQEIFFQRFFDDSVCFSSSSSNRSNGIFREFLCIPLNLIYWNDLIRIFELFLW